MPEEKKIDLGWKEQAEREKQKLAEELDARAGEEDEGGLPGDMGEPTFLNLATGIAAQAMMFLGLTENPLVGQRVVDLVAARFQIDILGMLAEKTKGNLTPEEEKTLQGILGEMRMVYVEMSKRVAQAVAERQAKGGAAGGAAGAGGKPAPGAEPPKGGKIIT
jgi:hypothetical protein